MAGDRRVFDGNLGVILISLMAAVAVAGLAAALFYPAIAGGGQSSRRLAEVKSRSVDTKRTSRGADAGRNRRRQVQETLKQLDAQKKNKKKRVPLRIRIEQAGLGISVRAFWVMSILFGLFVAFVVLVTGSGWAVTAITAFVASVGVPRWFLGYAKKRRMTRFLNEFANAIDVVVRGVKSGLPVNDCFQIVAKESADPVGPEFRRIVEGQRLGVTLEQGMERMYERMPLAEVNFLSIVMTIQKKTGGNLAEALANLSTVLRDRKKMQGKIKSMSQEAKSSAAIIGALPIIIMLLVYMTSPEYITILWTDRLGQVMLVGCAVWMTIGVLVMRKMINFDF